MTWEYRCPACRVRVVSGWPDPICPVFTCRAVLDVVEAPEPTAEEVARVLREAEEAKR